MIRGLAPLVLALVAAACVPVPMRPSATPGPTGDGVPSPQMSETPAQSTAGRGPIQWVVETDPVPSSRDAADDPAIWVDRERPERTVIIGTDKKGEAGLIVYDLNGRALVSAGDEAMNNVDLQEGVTLGSRTAVIVAATSIEGRTVELFELDTDELRLDPVPGGSGYTGIRGGGICVGREGADGLPLFVTRGNGDVQHWVATFEPAGAEMRLVREFSLGSRVEGCVVDDEAGALYLSEESEGIWRTDVEPEVGAEPELAEPVDEGRLTPDVEGLAIADHGGVRYLLASSQGDDTFVVYRIQGSELTWVGDFQVEGPSEDGVSHTDGIEVTTDPLPPPFERGLLVVQDDDNEEPDDRDANQNFKLVPWGRVLDQLGIE